MAVDVLNRYKSFDLEPVLGKGHSLPTTPEIAQEGARVFTEVLLGLSKKSDMHMVLAKSEPVRVNFCRCFAGTTPVVDDAVNIALSSISPEGLSEFRDLLDPFQKQFSLIKYRSMFGWKHGFVNIAAASLVVDQNPCYFDPNIKRYLANWLQGYPEKWVTEGRRPQSTIIRHGLLSGYPLKAVLRYSNEGSKFGKLVSGCANQGFTGYSREDEYYMDKLNELYLQSGIDEIAAKSLR